MKWNDAGPENYKLNELMINNVLMFLSIINVYLLVLCHMCNMLVI
jgi:hypothetical protein